MSTGEKNSTSPPSIKNNQFRHLIWKWHVTRHTRPIWHRLFVLGQNSMEITKVGSVRSNYRAGAADTQIAVWVRNSRLRVASTEEYMFWSVFPTILHCSLWKTIHPKLWRRSKNADTDIQGTFQCFIWGIVDVDVRGILKLLFIVDNVGWHPRTWHFQWRSVCTSIFLTLFSWSDAFNNFVATISEYRVIHLSLGHRSENDVLEKSINVFSIWS